MPRSARILDFDIENRPLSYWYEGRTTAEITAIAWGVPGGEIHCRAIGRGIKGSTSARQMLREFVAAYDEADIVTGHYVRKHDLPIINGALIELGMPPLRPKRVQDTRLDLSVRWKDLPASQEYLGDMLGLEAPKEPMSQHRWRMANRLSTKGVAETRRRVIGDVRQHMELRAKLLERGLLGPPRWWKP